MADQDKTRLIRPNIPSSGEQQKEDKTRLISRPPKEIPLGTEIPPTRILEGSKDDDKTRLAGPIAHKVSEPAASKQDFMNDPVVGWVAIVLGPGKGTFVRLGYGLNTIGRGADQRVRLDYGDQEISRKNHATITYDPRGKKFYLQHGGGQNLTYLGDLPVLQPVEIVGGETITLAGTSLRFIPLCGPTFEWANESAAA